MAVFWTDTLRNSIIDAWVTGLGATPKIRVYSGAVPADETIALGAQVMLVEWTGSWAAASVGARAFNGTAAATSAAFGSTPLVATFYRILNSGATVSHEQGVITTTAVGTGDMLIDNTSIGQSQTVNLNSFTKTAPAA